MFFNYCDEIFNLKNSDFIPSSSTIFLYRNISFFYFIVGNNTSFTRYVLVDNKFGIPVMLEDIYKKVIFSHFMLQRFFTNKDGKAPSKDSRTLPMIPEMCFACSNDNKQPFVSNPPLDKDGLSQLLTCAECKVTVHASK